MTDGRTPMVGVVIVNYGSHDLIEKNFSATADRVGDVRLIIVDNYKSDAETVAMRQTAQRHDWTLLENGTNVGFGRGANAGLGHAWALDCDVALVVNPDIRMDARVLSELASTSRQLPFALVSPRVVTPAGSPWGQKGSIDMTTGRLWTDERTQATWLSGACLAGSRSAWTLTGGFDNDYILYWEDVDLSVRARSAGIELVLRDDLQVEHAVGGTQNAAAGKSATYVYYNCRNRLVFCGKHIRPRLRLHWLVETPADTRRVLSRGLPASRMHKLTKSVGPALAGCLAGLLWLVVPQGRRTC